MAICGRMLQQCESLLTKCSLMLHLEEGLGAMKLLGKLGQGRLSHESGGGGYQVKGLKEGWVGCGSGAGHCQCSKTAF